MKTARIPSNGRIPAGAWYGSAIFLGAFLLFLVQPLTARRLLPGFGGAPTVWLVSLVFYQTGLLLGYLYAHWGRSLSARRQAFGHLLLLIVSLAFLPLAVDPPAGGASEAPARAILGILAASVLLPYGLLAATGPLLQSWLSAAPSEEAESSRVYRLFALSNSGSLLGLLSYPFLLEPWTSLATQLAIWSAAFFVFALLSAYVAIRVMRGARAGHEERMDRPVAIAIGSRVLWLALPAAGSVLLLATTNQITRNVAAIPLFWVVPLAIYLMSFVIAFERDRWYLRPVWGAVFLMTLVGLLHLLQQDGEAPLTVQLGLYSVNLLAGCMIAHGELARRRPPAASLTRFYLYVAAGGALGGAFVSLAAPSLFRGFWEYPIGLFAIYVLGGVTALFESREPSEDDDGDDEAFRARARLGWAGGGLVLIGLLAIYVRGEVNDATVMARSFFGVLRVYDGYKETENWQRYLWNGPIAHGSQWMAPGRWLEPTTYYSPESGVGLALSYTGEPFGRRGRRIGVVGLGAGSVAAYGRIGDVLRFYELNPGVAEIAWRDFHYLDATPATVEVVVGDARMSMARELSEGGPMEYDILILDAFAGDAIPVHLLTREAFELYDQHLADDGVLVVHISNLHLDLEPLVRAQAEHLNAAAQLVESDIDAERDFFLSDWMLVTRNGHFVSDPEIQAYVMPRLAERDMEPVVLWTDDFSNVLGTLR